MNLIKQILAKSYKWIAPVTGIIMSGLSIFIFNLLVTNENKQIEAIINTQLIATENKIKNQIDFRVLALKRMAKRWSFRGGTPQTEWEADAIAYITDDSGYQAIEWIDKNYYIRWVVPKKGNEAIINLNLSKESKRKQALEISRKFKQPYLSRTVNLFQGGKGFLAYIPVFKKQEFDGFILGVFKINNFLRRTLQTEILQGYQIFLYDQSELIYSTIYSSEPKNNPWRQERSLNYKGINWTLVIIPNNSFIKSYQSPLAKVVLSTGLIISWLLALTIYFSQKNQQRSQILKKEIQKRMKIESSLNNTTLLQKAILDSANYSIISTTIDGTIQAFNKGAEKMLGYTADEVIGKVTPAIIHDIQEIIDEAKNLSQELGKTIEPGFEVFVAKAKLGLLNERIWTYIRKDGSRFPVLLSITSLRNQNEEIIGFLGIASDITKQQEAEAQLKQAFQELEIKKTEAEEANRAKSEFLAMMSHEIRTPMNGVIGMTGLLLDTNLDSQQTDFVETIRHSGDSLLTIINDILDFSKIESGKIELEIQPFNLRDCVESALDLFAHQVSKKNLELVYYWHPYTPKNILGDVSRIRQIIVNLLSNAIKFTDKGEVVLSVSSKPINEELKTNYYEIKFAIKDTGIGIPENLKNRLFKPFSQVDSSTARKYGGTGLGLVICKRLAEIMGGEMWVESEVNQGSTFCFTITAEIVDILPEIIPVDLQHKKVLIVDDNETNCQILTLQLQTWNMKTLAFQEPQKSLEYLTQVTDFDLIILDGQMPEMDGLTLASEIRKLPTLKHIPLILLTSLNISAQEIHKKINFDAILTKPIKQSRLYEILVSVFSLEAKKVTPKLIEIKPEIINDYEKLSDLQILLAEDNLVNQKVALLNLKKLGYRADVAANGLEVIEALQRQFYDVVLMDVQMPEMDGLQATHWLRQNLTKQPYIIAMTANAMEGDRQMCLDAGMNDYLTKPIHLELLKKALLIIDN